MKPPPSSHLAKRILFLETPWRTWWARAAPWLLKRLKPVWTIPVPWLRNVSGVMVPCLAPPSMPVACWFHLPPICPFYPQCQFHFLLVFIKFAMTFHLGGLTIKTSFLEMGQQVAVLLGRTCPEGTMCNTEPSSPDPPRHRHLQRSQQRSVGSGGDAPAGEAQSTFLPTIGDGSRLSRSSLARRQGVRETARAQVVFAKRLINRPGIVPRSHTVFSRLPSPAVLSRTSPVITASPLCPWTLLCRPGRCPSLGTRRHSLSQRLCPPHPGS